VPKDIEWSFTVVRPKPGKETTALSEVLDSLLLKHRPEDIRVLSPFGENHSLLARLFHRDSEGVVERELKKKLRHASTSGQIRWRSISKFKGLEEDVVVITDISNAAIVWLKDKPLKMTDLLYVGMTRAKFHVVLIISDNLYPSAKSKS
jgi:superfamily I DNA/RNA helicase